MKSAHHDAARLVDLLEEAENTIKMKEKGCLGNDDSGLKNEGSSSNNDRVGGGGVGGDLEASTGTEQFAESFAENLANNYGRASIAGADGFDGLDHPTDSSRLSVLLIRWMLVVPFLAMCFWCGINRIPAVDRTLRDIFTTKQHIY